MLKLVMSEKAVRLIELNNTLIFKTDMRRNKGELKKEIENMFNVKIDKINSLIRKNEKYVYAKLNSKNPAIDVATNLGMI